jgi:hypothetical protein
MAVDAELFAQIKADQQQHPDLTSWLAAAPAIADLRNTLIYPTKTVMPADVREFFASMDDLPRARPKRYRRYVPDIQTVA